MVHFEEALIALTAAERVIGRRPEDLPAGGPVLAGETAFRLHDTYGFPVDLTVELAAEYGVAVDRAGFDRALAEQRERSRGGRKAELARQAELTTLYESLARRLGESTFLGYDATTAEAHVVAIVRDGIEYATLEAFGDAELRTEPRLRPRSSSTGPRSTPRAVARLATTASCAWQPVLRRRST